MDEWDGEKQNKDEASKSNTCSRVVGSINKSMIHSMTHHYKYVYCGCVYNIYRNIKWSGVWPGLAGEGGESAR